MTPEESERLIEAAGGPIAFAKLLGIEDAPWRNQRISNWRRRGIPPAVVLEHHELFQRLRSTVAVG